MKIFVWQCCEGKNSSDYLLCKHYSCEWNTSRDDESCDRPFLAVLSTACSTFLDRKHISLLFYVYLGLLISTSHYSYLLGSWLCWDDKTDDFRATYPCSENKAACLYHSWEIPEWRLTHEHSQITFWKALWTHIVTSCLEMSVARALRRVHMRGCADS